MSDSGMAEVTEAAGLKTPRRSAARSQGRGTKAFPTDAEALALLLIATRERREARQAEIVALAGRTDPAELLAVLFAHRLPGVIRGRLAEAGATDLEAVIADSSRAWHEEAQRRGMALELATLALVARLESSGLPTLPLKGALLSRDLYGWSGARPAGDVDLLTAPEHVFAALGVLRDLGYATPADPVGRGGLPVLHFKLDATGSLPTTELHHRVHWYESAFASAVLASSERDGLRGRVAAPHHDLAMLLLFYARDGFSGLRLLADISTWWDCHEGELEAADMAQLPRQYPALARPLRAATDVAARFGGVPSVILGEDLRLSGRTRLATELADWPFRGNTTQIRADAALIDGLLAPLGDGRSFLRRQFVPSRAEIAWRERAQLSGGKLAIAFTQTLYPLRMTARWSLALGLVLLRRRPVRKKPRQP